MLHRKYIFTIFVLLTVFISSFTNCFSMEVVVDIDEDNSSTTTKRNSDDDSLPRIISFQDDVVPLDRSISAISSPSGTSTPSKKKPINIALDDKELQPIIYYDNHKSPIKLNKILYTLYDNNKELLAQHHGYEDTAIEPFQSGILSYRILPSEDKNKANNECSYDVWDNHAVFLSDLDKKLYSGFIPNNLKTTEFLLNNSLKLLWSTAFAAGPFGSIPVMIGSGAVVFKRFFPSDETGDILAYTFASMLAVPSALQGCNFAEKLKGLADPRGFTTAHNDHKPHVLPYTSEFSFSGFKIPCTEFSFCKFKIPYPSLYFYRPIAFCAGLLDTAPRVAYLWKIERMVSKYTKSLDPLNFAAGLTVSLLISGIDKSYDPCMTALKKANHKSQTKLAHMANQKKKLMKDFPAIHRTLINADGSDEYVVLLDKKFKKIIKELTLELGLKAVLNDKSAAGDARDIMVDILISYAKEKFKGKRISTDLEKK